MAKLSKEELKALEQKELKKEPQVQIIEKVIGGVKLFSHPILGPDEWYDDVGEAGLAASEAKRQEDYKKSGLDSFGRTKEQLAMSGKKAELLAKKAALVADIKKIDLEIQQLKVEDFKEEKKVSKK